MADEIDWLPDGFVPDDRVAIEYVREVLDDVRTRLMAGAEGPGATLTADECIKVLGALRNPAWPNSRPRHSGVDAASVAMYCYRLEKGGMSKKNAVISTMQHFACSRSTVYAARKAYGPSK